MEQVAGGFVWSDARRSREVSLAIEKDWRMSVEGGKISGWWQGAESFVTRGRSVEREEKGVYSVYTLQLLDSPPG